MESLYGTNIPTAVLSGVAMVWAGALIVLDKRHAIRHTLTMLSGACLLASQIFDFFYMLGGELFPLFAATARYLLWCISYTVILDCVPGPRRSLQRIIPIIAYTWSAIGIIIMIVYAIMYATSGFYNDALPIFSRIGWYGSVPLILGLYILSFSQDYKMAVRDFCRSFAIYILLLTVVSAGVIIGTVSFLAGRILDCVVMSITLVFVCYCAPRWVGVKHDRLADRSDDEEDNPFVQDGTQNPDTRYDGHTQNPNYRYDPDDVYTKEAQDLDRY
ncbi:hypothetical protein O0I10_007428 [Lichtheimia ornata]|uniref:Uncharacterized protein n=1 Tax=Lichtheimia ornata TaxID=688661 RepID=A0AAD7V355_9FUNG|nr:uncharacterized protein O0I10_007428 [Lichtheimia ornata]KAJ8656831.1 hypothetical protein O0I10_007428 [Lichtheimia ornata]